MEERSSHGLNPLRRKPPRITLPHCISHTSFLEVHYLTDISSKSELSFSLKIKNLFAGLPWGLSGRVRLPVQGTWVRSLIQDNPTCRRAAQRLRRKYCAWPGAHVRNDWRPHAPEPSSAGKTTAGGDPHPQRESSPSTSKDPARPKIHK